MADYTTRYLFEIDLIESNIDSKAKAIAKTLEQTLEKANATNKVLAETERDLGAAFDITNKSITSQTRRFGNYRKRVDEVRGSVATLGTTTMNLYSVITGAGAAVFDPLTNSARKASNEIVGQSIIPDMEAKIRAIYQRISAQGSVVFDSAVEDAKKLQQIIVNLGKTGIPAVSGMSLLGGTAGSTNVDFWTGISKVARTMQTTQPVVESWFDAFNEGLNQASLQWFGLRRLGYGLESVGRSMTRTGKEIVQFMTSAAEAYLDFNEAATRAAMAMEMQAEMQDVLEEKILDSSRALGLYTPSELAEGLRLWAAGTGVVIQTEEDLNEILAQTIDLQKLASMNMVQLGSVTEIAGGIMQGFGMDLDDVAHIAEVLNFVSAKSFANVTDIGDAAAYAGPMAAALGVTFEELTATVGILANANLKGTRVGRALNQMFIHLLKPTKAHNDAMNEALGLSEELGESWKDIAFPEDEAITLARYIEFLVAVTEDWTAAQRNALIATIARASEVPILITLMEEMRKSQKEGINIIEEETAALQGAHSLWDQMWTRWEGEDSSRAKRMRARWDAALMDMGQNFVTAGLPAMETLSSVMQQLADLIDKYPMLVTGAMLTAGSGLVLGGIAIAMGQLAQAVASYFIIMQSITAAQVASAAATTAVAGGTGVAVGTAGAVGAASFAAWGAVAAGLIPIAVGVIAATTRQKSIREQLEKESQVTQQMFDDLFRKQRAGAPYGDWVARTEEGEKLIQDILGENKTWISQGAELAKIHSAIRDSVQETADAFAERRMGGEEEGWMRGWKDIEKAQKDAQEGMFPPGMGVSPDAAAQKELNDKLVDLQEKYENDILQLHIRNEEKIAAAQTSWAEWQEDATESHLQRKTDLEEKYAASREKRLADYTLSRQKAEEDYAFKEVRALEDYRLKIADAEVAHLKELEDTAAEHNARLIELGEDARNADIQAIEEYQQQQQQITEDHQQNLVQLEEEYQTAIREAAEEHAERLADIEKQYQEDALDDAEQHAERLADLETSYHEEVEDAAERHAERLADIAKDLQETLADDAARHAERLADLETSYYEAVEEAAENHAERLADILKDYNEDIIDDAEDHAKRLEDLDKDYQDAIEDDAERHAKKISDLAEKAQKADERAAEDHLLRMERMEQDHRDRLNDLIRTRDARGLLKELRDFARNRDEANEDYEIGKDRRKKDYEDRAREEEENFADAKRRRQEDYEDRVNEEKERYADQKKQRREDYEEQVKEEKERAEKAARKRQEDYEESIQKENERAEKERQQRQDEYEKRRTELEEQAAEEKLRRQEEYEEQVAEEKERAEERKADRKAEYDERVAEERARYAEQVAEETTRYADQKAKRQAEYELRRQELAENFAREGVLRREAYEQQVVEERERFAEQRVQQQQHFEESQRQEAESYARSAERRAEDYERAKQQAAEAFSRQEETAALQFEAAMEAEDERNKQAHEKRKAQYEKQLAQLAAELEEEEQLVRDAHLAALRKLAGYWDELEGSYQDHYDRLLRDVEIFLDDYQYIWDQLQDLADSIPELPDSPRLGGDEPGYTRPWGRQTGGYAVFGKYWLGEAGKEYVLNSDTVRALEGRFGPLNQQLFKTVADRQFDTDIEARDRWARKDYDNRFHPVEPPDIRYDVRIGEPYNRFHPVEPPGGITPIGRIGEPYNRFHPVEPPYGGKFGSTSNTVTTQITQQNTWNLPTGTSKETLEQVREIAYEASYEAIADASKRALETLKR